MPIKKARLRISDYNSTRKSKLKHNERRIRMVSLSLTSMVDMFAILVIFLLANSASVTQWIELGHDIQLPKAKASDPPPRAATLQISKDTLYGDDRKAIMKVNQISGGPMTIEPLKAWLTKRRNKDGYVNIVGHTKLPYGVIRRIIATCQDAGFGNVNLAVQPKG